MTLDYTHDFIRLYSLYCGICDTREKAYEAVEVEYRQQYRREIALGIMRETKFSNYESFRVCLHLWLKDPKNRKRIEL